MVLPHIASYNHLLGNVCNNIFHIPMYISSLYLTHIQPKASQQGFTNNVT